MSMVRVLETVAICSIICAMFGVSTELHADDAVDARGVALFRDEVKPLLVGKCLECHGGRSTKGDFDLRTRESLVDSGMVEPGDAAASYLLELVRHEQEPFMPFKSKRLSDEQIKQIAKWIDLGAPYDGPLAENASVAAGPMKVTAADRESWNFRRLQPVEPPTVADDSWSRTPIDRFVGAQLAKQQLAPSRPAKRRTLIRRVYFDLIGLPPTPEEVAEFEADESPDAYEQLVDRLLANPHFGERWARHWLDVVRFAESHGFEHDHNRDSAYHYRDFVIRAFNDDMPYDQFVRWQLAGDEFKPDDPMALMATGFLAAGVHNTQITASQVEKERYDELDDIVATVGTSMLGLTVGCARCHDHKYDPIPTSDYYRLAATFTTTVRSERNLELNAEEYRRDHAAFNERLRFVTAARNRYEQERLAEPLRQWAAIPANLKSLSDTSAWIVLEPIEYTSSGYKDTGTSTLQLLEDGSLLVCEFNPVEDEYVVVVRTTLDNLSAVRLEALTHDSLPLNGPGRAANGNFALSDFSVSATPADGGAEVNVPLHNPRATFEQNREGLSIASSVDADRSSGWAIDHGGVGHDQAAVFDLAQPLKTGDATVLKFRLKFRGNANHGLGRFRLSVARRAVPSDIRGVGVPQAAIEAAFRMSALANGDEGASDSVVPSQKHLASLMRWYRTTDPTWRNLDSKVVNVARTAPKRQMARVLYCSEGVPPLRLATQGVDFFEKTYELERGDPNRKVREAQSGFLQILTSPTAGADRWKVDPPQGATTSFRRRSLANWITDSEAGAGHLVARVIVNRLWQHCMGRGLVATPSDFGLQGDTPSHPELIDWLANELIRGGWHLKPIHRLIVTSAVYRQDSQFDTAKGSVDPTNQWLWRYAPRRLEAESIRDATLSVSHQMDESMFGPGLLEPDHTRRSIYFFLKRSQMPRMMQQFDCPDGLSGLAVRSATTVAPQALVLMNHSAVQRWAEAFAKRIEGETAQNPAEVVDAAFRDALGRQPADTEVEAAIDFLERQSSLYKEDNVSNPDHLAIIDFCQAMFCLNEFVYIE